MRVVIFLILVSLRVFGGCALTSTPSSLNQSADFSFGLGTPLPHKACRLVVYGPTEVRQIAYAENVVDYSQKVSYTLAAAGDYVFSFEWRQNDSSSWNTQETWHLVIGSSVNTRTLSADTTSIVMAGYEFWWGSAYDFSSFDARNASYQEGMEGYFLQTGALDYSSFFNQIYAVAAKSTQLDGVSTSYTTQAPTGYYSHEASVLNYHSRLLKHVGVNAVIADFSNVVDACFPESYLEAGSLAPRHAYIQAIEQNAQAQASLRKGQAGSTSFASNLFQLYSTWDQNAESPKIIPMAGALSYDDSDTKDLSKQNLFLIKGADGLSPFQRQILYFLAMQERFPQMSVFYEGKPLLLIYHGVFSVHSFVELTTAQLEELNQNTALPFHPNQLTIRHLSGFVESLPDLWDTNARQAHPPYVATKGSLWSWCDRIHHGYDDVDGYSSYAMTPDGSSVEFSSACLSSLSYTSGEKLYPFKDGEQYAYFLSKALKLQPKFLLIGQFNQFVNDGAGFSLQGTLNFEPTVQWGQQVYDKVTALTQQYLAYAAGAANARVVDIKYRSLLGSGERTPILGLTLSGGSQRVAAVGSNPAQVTGLSAGSYSLQLMNVDGSLNATNASWTQSEYASTPDTTRSNFLRRSRSYANYLTYHSGDYDASVDYLALDTPALFADLSPGTYCLLSGSAGTDHAISHLVLEDWVGQSRVSSLSLRSYVQAGDGSLLSLKVLADTTVSITTNPAPLQGSISEILPKASLSVFSADNTLLAQIDDTELHTVTLKQGVNYLLITSSASGVSLVQVGL